MVNTLKRKEIIPSNKQLKVVMRNTVLVIALIGLMANGCKSPISDSDPQEDDQAFSNLFGSPQAAGTVAPTDLDEASGLGNSRSNDLYLWSHNDSGGDPVLFLLTQQGADSGRFELEGAQNIDWEDFAIGPGPDDALTYLYAADIGDNNARRESLTIYRVPEPDLNIEDIPATSTLTNVEAIEFVYEDGARDAETLMVDPATKDLYIVTKRESSVILYALPYPQNLVEPDTARRVLVLPFTFATGGDISANGNEVLIKNYQNVYHWAKTGNETIAELLANEPNRLVYTVEPQGEGIGWKSDGSGYFTLSEIDNSDAAIIYSYNKN